MPAMQKLHRLTEGESEIAVQVWCTAIWSYMYHGRHLSSSNERLPRKGCWVVAILTIERDRSET